MADRIAVVYSSTYGSAKQYAHWIAEETGAHVFSRKGCSAADLKDYDTIIIGGGILAGSIEGIDFLKRNIKKLENKKILSYAVGLDVFNQDSCNRCLEKNFTRRIKGIPCFFFPGEYFPEKVTKGDRMLMKLVIGRLDKMSMRTEEQDMLLDVMKNGGDLKKKEAIEPMMDFLKANNIID